MFHRLFTLIIALGLTFISFAQKSEFTTLTGEGYEIQHPNNWTVDQTGQMNTAFILFSPAENDSDQFRENINLIVQDVSQYNLNLAQFAEASVTQIQNLITGAEIYENELKNGEVEYQRVRYSGVQGKFNLMYIQHYWVVNNVAYILTFTTQIDTYEAYSESGSEIMKSFKIL